MSQRLKQYCCPTCGNSLGEAPTLDVMRANIVRHLRPVLVALYEAGEAGITPEELFQKAWLAPIRKDTDRVRVRTYINQLRKDVDRYGYYIPKNSRRDVLNSAGKTAIYRLLPKEVGP